MFAILNNNNLTSQGFPNYAALLKTSRLTTAAGEENKSLFGDGS